MDRLKQRSRAQGALGRHRPWFMYVVAKDLEQPFTLEDLQAGISKRTGVRPRKDRLLREAHEFYREFDIPIVYRVEPGSDAFVVNHDIALNMLCYQAVIQAPQERPGRRREGCSRTEPRKYIRTYERLMRRPERFMAEVFRTATQATAPEISLIVAELNEGVVFRPDTIRKLLDRYIGEGRGPPYIEEVQPGTYRSILDAATERP